MSRAMIRVMLDRAGACLDTIFAYPLRARRTAICWALTLDLGPADAPRGENLLPGLDPRTLPWALAVELGPPPGVALGLDRTVPWALVVESGAAAVAGVATMTPRVTAPTMMAAPRRTAGFDSNPR